MSIWSVTYVDNAILFYKKGFSLSAIIVRKCQYASIRSLVPVNAHSRRHTCLHTELPTKLIMERTRSHMNPDRTHMHCLLRTCEAHGDWDRDLCYVDLVDLAVFFFYRCMEERIAVVLQEYHVQSRSTVLLFDPRVLMTQTNAHTRTHTQFAKQQYIN